jgi:hypothetical protein
MFSGNATGFFAAKKTGQAIVMTVRVVRFIPKRKLRY